MEKLISVSLILSIFTIYLHFSPVYSKFLGFESSTDQQKECLDSFKKVTNLENLKEFLKILETGFNNGYFTYKDLSKCFESKNINKWRIAKFRNLIKEANVGNICSGESIDELVNLHPYLSSTIKDNKKSRLAPWWEKFVKQVIVKCKSSFLQKLDLKKPDGVIFQGILNLAANLRWKDAKNFIKETVDVPEIPDDSFVGQDWSAADLVDKTSGKINELSNAEIEEEDYESDKNPPKQPKYDVQLTRPGFRSLAEMFRRCHRITFYREWLFDPLFKLSKLRYDDSALKLDDPIASDKYIHAWLSSIKLCMLLSHINLLKLANGMTRLKIGQAYRQDNMDEIHAMILQTKIKHFIPRANRYPKILQELDSFSEIDEELVSKISAPSKEYNDKLSNTYKSNIKRAVYSEKFLKLIADFLQSTDAFAVPIKEPEN